MAAVELQRHAEGTAPATLRSSEDEEEKIFKDIVSKRATFSVRGSRSDSRVGGKSRSWVDWTFFRGCQDPLAPGGSPRRRELLQSTWCSPLPSTSAPFQLDFFVLGWALEKAHTSNRKCSLISRDVSFGPFSTMNRFTFPDAAETNCCIPSPPREYGPPCHI